MSVYSNNLPGANETSQPCPGVALILTARVADLGGFTVRRLLPSHHQHMVGPWIFFDHFGPAHLSPPKGMDVRPHPHVNMATVTYLYEGAVLHQDNTGAVQTILPGAINLMLAGSGIVHSERTPKTLRDKGFDIHGLQLWLALPEDREEDDPAFYHYAADHIPQFTQGAVTGKVLMGSAYGVTSPVELFSPTLYLEARVPKEESLEIPLTKKLALYVVSGSVVCGTSHVEEGMMAILKTDSQVNVRATVDAKIVFIGGDPLGHRYIWWNFVSSKMDRIHQAAEDWERGRFALIPNDHEELIPLPERRP